MKEYIVEYETEQCRGELIRCKDCVEWIRRYGTARSYCGKVGWVVGEDDFCSKAERIEK